MQKLKTIIIAGLIILAVSLLFFPWLLYAIGLSNIEGRPSLPTNATLTPDEAQKIWEELKEKGPIQIEKISPWHYVFMVLEANDKPKSGEYLAWFVARNYNSTHMRNKRMIYWHLSGASLTIWLTRNWSAEQLLLKAKEIKETRQHSTSRSSRTSLCRDA